MEDTAPRYHVVLIGIDRYLGDVPTLTACVNDIDAIQDILLRRLHIPRDRILRFAAPMNDGTPRPTEVPTQEPTCANLLAALTKLGDDVKPGDRVFIYYSGHGTHREVIHRSDGSRYHWEALVPVDGLAQKEDRLLFDWKLNQLLGKIAERTSAMTVVIDACCSAGATRELPAPGVRLRWAPPPLEPLELAPSAVPPPATGERGVLRGLAANPHDFMVVAACLDDERARESAGRAEATLKPERTGHGLLTRAILVELEAVADPALAELRWGRIWRAVMAGVEQSCAYQHPWLSSNPARRVFAGPEEEGDIGYAVVVDAATKTYRIKAGSLVGVTEEALVALYPPLGSPAATATFPPLGTPGDLKQRIGLLRVLSATPGEAVAKADPTLPPPSPLAAGVRGRLVQLGERAKMLVALTPEDQAMARRIATSPFLAITEVKESAQVTLVKRSDKSWAITDAIYGTGEAAGPSVPTLPFLPNTPPPPGKPDVAVKLVEHYYAYIAPVRAGKNCVDLPSKLQVKLLDASSLTEPMPPNRAQDPDLLVIPGDGASYHLKAGRFDGETRRWIARGDAFCIRIENSSERDLYVTLFNCDSDGRVVVFASRALVEKRGRAAFWSPPGLGNPIVAVLSEGQSLGVDRWVAIGTTDPQATLDELAMQTTFAQVARGEEELAVIPAFPAQELWTAAFAVVRMTAR